MRILATRWFHRWSRRVGVSPADLCRQVEALSAGAAPDADLGGGLLKLRLARPGGGKSGGYRTILAFQGDRRAVYLFAFAKSEKSNLTSLELKDWRHSGSALLHCSEWELEQRLDVGDLIDMEIQA